MMGLAYSWFLKFPVGRKLHCGRKDKEKENEREAG